MIPTVKASPNRPQKFRCHAPLIYSALSVGGSRCRAQSIMNMQIISECEWSKAEGQRATRKPNITANNSIQHSTHDSQAPTVK